MTGSGIAAPYTLAYDWGNRLNKKTVGSSVTQFGYDGAEAIHQVAGSTITRWIYGPGLDEVLADQVGTTYRYLLRDALNSTVILTNATGGIVERYAYDAYGQVKVQNASRVVQTTAPRTPWLFTGRFYHTEAKLYDFRNRAYHALLGRFPQPDPVGFAGKDVNHYRYVGNNPVDRMDPFGLYGTNDCSYYDTRCQQSGGNYYCSTAPRFCEAFPKQKDPDPTRDFDFEGGSRCIRQCLQDCDQMQSACQSQHRNPDPSTDSFFDPKPMSCHYLCYGACGATKFSQ